MPNVEYHQIMNRIASCNDCGRKFYQGDYTYFIHAPKVSVVICKECYKKIRDKFNEIENTFRMKVRKNEKIQKVTSCY